MNTDNFWGDKVEYVQKLAKEVADLKGVMQDISQQVRRIERRIDLVLPEGRRAKERKVVSGDHSGKAPTMSENQAHQTIDKLKECLYQDKPIDSELRNMTVKHGLTPIARVLGMTNSALPPKSKLILNIITRIRQSAMLTENIRKMPHVAEDKKHYGDRNNANH